MDSATTHERLAQFRRMCREHGLVATVQRQAVFETLLEREDHPTVDQVYERLAKRVPAIHAPRLSHLGLVRALGIGHSHLSSRLAARFIQDPPESQSVLCSCERIIDIEDDRLIGSKGRMSALWFRDSRV
jgi:Fur family peroxide stress response transcriptional regulator